MNYMKRKALGFHYEVSLVAASFAVGGLAAAGATAMAVGAGITAAGSILGIKEAKPIGGLLMAGGGIASGAAGLGLAGGAATATGTLGTLSAGAQLVGGALQGVGVLTGNDKMAGIGGLINAAGFAGSSIDGMQQTSGTVNGGAPDPSWTPAGSVDQTINNGLPDAGWTPSGNVNASVASQSTSQTIPSSVSGISNKSGNIFDKINKYDNIIKMAGDFASGVSKGNVEADKLALEREKMALQYRPAQALGSVGVSAPATPSQVQRINQTGILNVPGVS